MRVDVYGTFTSALERDIRDRTIVIIDTLRATSTIVTALNNGCKQVVPVVEVEEAMAIANTMGKEYTVLGGERNSVKIPGFDFGNSPLEYTSDQIKDKLLIFTSTNGTGAILRGKLGKDVLIGAMINDKAIADRVLELDNDMTILCAGTEGKFTAEDFLTAGAIISRLSNYRSNIQMDDAAVIAQKLFLEEQEDLFGALKDFFHCKRLIENGFKEDVEYCLQRDITKVVPRCFEGLITV